MLNMVWICHFKFQKFIDKYVQTCLEKYGLPYACYLPQCREASGVTISQTNRNFQTLLGGMV